MEKLCEKLGYRFRDSKLLVTALTHPSYGGDHHVPHYQRLEFLGDAVLELAVSEYLYSELPEVDEGKLTRIRAALVREETLCRAAKRIGLGAFIRLSVGEERSGGRNKPSILCDVMEAVLAAVYLDGGLEEARALIHRVLLQREREEVVEERRRDFKTELQELVQRRSDQVLRYEMVGSSGPDHAKVFEARVTINGQTAGTGTGRSKKEAEQAAARNALDEMKK